MNQYMPDWKIFSGKSVLGKLLSEEISLFYPQKYEFCWHLMHKKSCFPVFLTTSELKAVSKSCISSSIFLLL